MTDLLPIGILLLALLGVAAVFAVAAQRLRGHGRRRNSTNDGRNDGSDGGGGTANGGESNHRRDGHDGHGGGDAGAGDGGGGSGD